MSSTIFKRLGIWMCFSLLSLTFISCSSDEIQDESSAGAVISKVDEESSTDIEASSEEAADSSFEESTEEAAEPAPLAIQEVAASFSNHVALVEIQESPELLNVPTDGITYALIDTEGAVKLIFHTADWDGFCMYDDILCLEKEGSLYFYDAEGALAFQFETTDEIKRYAVQGYGDDHWVILREESGFSSRGVYLFSVDQEGNLSEKEYDITEISDAAGAGDVQYDFTLDYMGDGIFMRPVNASSTLSHLYYMYDIQTGSLYYSGYLCLYAEFYDGVALARFSDSAEYAYNSEFGAFALTSDQLREWLTVEYEGAVDDTRFLEISAEVKSLIASGVESAGAYKVPYSENYKPFDVSSGVLMVEDGANTIYYDFIHGTTIPLPVYEGEVRVESTGAFSGEYARLVLRGADGNYYLTIINRQGEPMYEPVMAEGADKLYGSSNWNGYILDADNGRYWSPDGELHEDDRFLNISENLYWDTSIMDWNVQIAFSDGYGFYEDAQEVIYIESWDGSTEISEIRLTPETVYTGNVSIVSAD